MRWKTRNHTLSTESIKSSSIRFLNARIKPDDQKECVLLGRLKTQQKKAGRPKYISKNCRHIKIMYVSYRL